MEGIQPVPGTRRTPVNGCLCLPGLAPLRTGASWLGVEDTEALLLPSLRMMVAEMVEAEVWGQRILGTQLPPYLPAWRGLWKI